MTWEARAGAKLGDRYALEAKVGEGGMGEVWRARHLALESEVAIKFLSKALASNDETRKRFLMEAKLTAQIRTRHAVQVFDFGVTDDGHPYLVMELLQGEPLSHRIERLGRLDLKSTVRIMSAAAKALAKAHNLGIIHRDFKPDNVFLTLNDEKEDEVKVVDFGIAKLLGSLDETETSPTEFAEAAKSLSSLTRTGRLVGTPNYMSPEQIGMSSDLGPAVDIWAFGIVAFECLTGQSPFAGEDVMALFSEITLGKFRNARDLNPLVPRAFDAWFRKACANNPADRFVDAPAASQELAAALTPDAARSEADLSSAPFLPVADGSAEPRARGIGNAHTLLNSSTETLVQPARGFRPAWIFGAVGAVAVTIAAFVAVKSQSPAAVPNEEHAPPAAPSHAVSAAPAWTAVAPPSSALPVVAVEALDASTPHVASASHHKENAKAAPPVASTAPPPPASAKPEAPAPAGGPPSPFSLPPLGL